MAARGRDNQRSRVLNAEAEFRKTFGLETATRTVLRSLAQRIVRSAWFKKQTFPRRVSTEHMVGLEIGYSMRCDQDYRTAWRFDNAPTTLDLLHELAHRMQPLDSALHGPEHCKAMLECVRRWMGEEAKVALLQTYRAHRVKTRVYTPEGRQAVVNTAARNRSKFVQADLQALLKELESPN